MSEIDYTDPGFLDAARDVYHALRVLLDRIDRRGTVDDSVILSRYGRAIHDAYVDAEKAFRDFETYFEDES